MATVEASATAYGPGSTSVTSTTPPTCANGTITHDDSTWNGTTLTIYHTINNPSSGDCDYKRNITGASGYKKIFISAPFGPGKTELTAKFTIEAPEFGATYTLGLIYDGTEIYTIKDIVNPAYTTCEGLCAVEYPTADKVAVSCTDEDEGDYMCKSPMPYSCLYSKVDLIAQNPSDCNDSHCWCWIKEVCGPTEEKCYLKCIETGCGDSPPTPPPSPPPTPSPPLTTPGLEKIRDKVIEFACVIYRIIQAVVGVLAMLMMILAGLKWMTSDDPDSRNEAKNRILYVIVGVLVVLLALDAVNLFAKTIGITADITCPPLVSTVIPDAIKSVICIGVRILQAVAGIIAMIALTMAGLKWIAADSPGDRAGAKKLAVNVIIGVLIIMIAGQALSALFSGAGATDFTCPAVSAFPGLGDLIITITYTVCVILRTLQIASGVVAAIAVMFAGLKWVASESPEDRSTAKRMVLGAILGFLIVLIAAQALATLFGSGLDFTCGAKIPSGIENIIIPAICAILNTIWAVAGIIAAMAIMLAGIKWLSSDDPEDRSDAKKQVINAIIGFLVVILGAQALGVLFGATPSFTTFTCNSGGGDEDYRIELRDRDAGVVDTRAGTMPTGDTTCAGKITGAPASVGGSPAKLTVAVSFKNSGLPKCNFAVCLLNSNDEVVDEGSCHVIHTLDPGDTKSQTVSGPVTDFSDDKYTIELRNGENAVDTKTGTLSEVGTCMGEITDLKQEVDATDLTVEAFFKNTGSVDCNFKIYLLSGIDVVASEPVTWGKLEPGKTHTYTVSGSRDEFSGDTYKIELKDEAKGTVDTKTGTIPKAGACKGELFPSTSTVDDGKLTVTGTFFNMGDVVCNFKAFLMSGNTVVDQDPDAPFWRNIPLKDGYSTYELSGPVADFIGSVSGSSAELPYVRATLCVIFNTIKAVAGIIAAIIIAFAGIKWMSSDDSGERGKAKRWIMNAIVGFLVVITGAQLSSTLFAGIGVANITGCGSSTLDFVKPTFCVILRTIQAVAAIIAAVVIGLAGMKWMAFDTDFEERNKAKGLAIQAIIGLLIVIVGVQFMNALFTDTGFTSFKCKTGSILSFVEQPLCVMLNILMAVAAIIAAITILFAAFKWFIAGGDPESRARAKGALFNVIVGFLIVVISAQFVNVVVNGNGLTEIGCSGDLGSDIVTAFVAPMCLILRAVQLLGVLIAMVVMLIAGMRWIALEDPEQRRAAKAYIFYSLIALVIVLLVTEFVNEMLNGAAGLGISPTDIACPAVLDEGIQETIRHTGCMVFNTMKLIGIILAVIATLYVGIKLMSTDDPEERSRAKMIMFNIMVGLTIVLMTTSFLGPIITKSGEAPGILSFTCDEGVPAQVQTTVEYVGCLFYWIFLIIAIALAILVISIAGLRWMLSDDVESRQSAKNMIVYVIIGTLVAILAWQIIGSILGEGTFRSPFTCSSFDNDVIKAQIQYTACLFIYLIGYSVAGLATILIAIAGLIWMFAEDPETRTKAKWIIGHVIMGALIIMAAAYFINALVNY